MPLGKKNCPNCSKENGGRTILCECAYHFPTKEIRQDLLEEKNKNIEKKLSSGDGRLKTCPNCSKEIHIKTLLCKCGWHFPSNSLNLKMLEDKENKTVKIYDKKGIGRKECPNCGVIVGGITKNCPKCNFDFILAKENKIKEKEQKKLDKENQKRLSSEVKMSPRTYKLLSEVMLDIIQSGKSYTPPYFSTKRENAEYILSKDIGRAKVLYNYALSEKCWPNIDWKYIGEKLGLAEGECFSEKEMGENKIEEE